MASLEQRGGWFRAIFRHGGKRYTQSLNTTDRKQAEALLGGIEKTLMLLEQRVLTVPEGVSLTDFLLAGGQVRPAPEQVFE